MKTKIGGGEISPHLFSLSHKRFLAALPRGFKKVLLPDLSDAEIDAELTKLYVENGGIIASEEDTTAATSTDGLRGGNAKPTARGNSKAKPRAVS